MKPGKDYIGVGCGAFIVNAKDEVLLMKRGEKSKNEIGHWSLPGGALEFNETFSQAVRREIKEELGVEIEIEDLICLTDHIIKDEGQHWVTCAIKSRIVDGEPKIMEPEKIAKIGWFAVDSLPEKLTISAVSAFDAYKNGYRIKR